MSDIASGARRVLMCVSGMSPAVITETLYALITQEPPFIPDEVHVVTTLEGRDKILQTLLAPETGHFHGLMRDYLPGRTVRFDASTVHVICEIRRQTVLSAGVWGGLMPKQLAEPVLETVPLSDITTDADNRAAGDTIYRVMRELKAVPGTRLHVSIAGGRKSMSFYAGHAFSLLAESEDKLSHVLVNEPFDLAGLGFYYPPPQPVTLQWAASAGKSARQIPISTALAEVRLAEMSVLRLGGLLGPDWPGQAGRSFDVAVTLAQDALVPPLMEVVLDSDGVGRLKLSGEDVILPPQQFSLFAIYALARVHEDELPDGAHLWPERLSAELWSGLAADFAHADNAEMQRTASPESSVVARRFAPVHSKIKNALQQKVGPVARHFVIEAVGQQSPKPYALTTPATNLRLALPSHWWKLLRAELVD